MPPSPTPPAATIRFVRTKALDLGRLSEWGLELLSPPERAGFDRLRPPASKRDYLAAHLALRLTIARAIRFPPADVRLGYDESGRPRVEGPPIQVSLTHCEGLGACAVSAVGDPVPIGLDAEPLAAAPRVLEVTDLALTRAEQRWADSAPVERNARLVALWTAKEAALKAQGTGIGGAIGANALLEVECRPEWWEGGCTGRFETSIGWVTTRPLPGDFCLAWCRLGNPVAGQADSEELIFPLGGS